ncbi:hypothetical protein ES703_82175 [subsurface metagenome]
MGLKPTFPDYYPGAPCPDCRDVIFDGVTPMFVEAWVFGIALCLGAPPFDPNRVWLLEQTAPCQWLGGEAGFGFSLIYTPTNSIFTISSGPVVLFSDNIALTCQTLFNNLNLICNFPNPAGINGWVTIFWGPGIGPGP